MRTWLMLPLLAACGGEFAPETDWTDGAVIYGTDNRQEYTAITGVRGIEIADAVAVQVQDAALSQRFNGTWDLYDNTTLDDYWGLCNGEPFADQPATGECTAFLVAPDVLATAGHCVSAATCVDTSYVFGFVMTSSTSWRSNFADDAVYRCDQVIGRSTGASDWALVQLDRPVVGRTPMTVRDQGKVALNTGLVLAGHPDGIPFKFAPGARVRTNGGGASFTADVDAFGGNSGSPVLNASTGTVEGILVAGNTDYVRQGGCYVRNYCSNGVCGGYETVTRTTEFASLIP